MKYFKINGLFIAGIALGLFGTPNSRAVTLEEALDNTNLTWTTGGNAPWSAENSPLVPSVDGTNAAMSGVIFADEESWLETTVTGPGVLSFWWLVSSDDLDLFEFQIDGITQSVISGESMLVWEYQLYVITNGSHTLRWRYAKQIDFNVGEDQAYLDQVRFRTGAEIPLAEALNTPYWGWNTGGNINPTFWEAQTNVFRVDGKAAESGAVTHLQESWMEVRVAGITNVSFSWKVSSETNYDFLTFLVDGITNSAISGELGWQWKTNILLTSGVHTLRWTFSKDDTDFFSTGLNRGWVDEVKFLPSNAPAPIFLSAPVLQPDGQAQFNLTYELGRSCEIQYATNLEAPVWNVLLRTNTLSATTPIVDAGATNSPVHRFYRAKAP